LTDVKTNDQVLEKRNLEIFKSKHCFPLSPRKVVFEEDGLPSTQGDLLYSVFDLIGSPNECDVMFLTDEFA
jgi:hypothetical protein